MNIMERVALTAEQEELRSSVRRLLGRWCPETEVRRLMETDTGFERDVHVRLAQEIGAVGLAVPERFGGAGASWREVAVVAEETGRALYGGPYLSSAVLSAGALLATEDEQACRDYLPALVKGEILASLAFVEPDRRWDAASTGTRAVWREGGYSLAGSKLYVIDGHTADLLLVTARIDDTTALFAVDRAAKGITTALQPTLDRTRKLAEIQFEDAPARLVGAPAHGVEAVSAAVRAGCAALVAEQVGGAQRLLEIGVDYANTREQFGRPIGSFQSIKHMCADMLAQVESARSLAHHASWAIAVDHPDAAAVVHAAKSLCSQTFLSVAATTIQIHGGIGFTWDHPAHLYYRRAKSDEVLFGTPAEHRTLLASLLGI